MSNEHLRLKIDPETEQTVSDWKVEKIGELLRNEFNFSGEQLFSLNHPKGHDYSAYSEDIQKANIRFSENSIQELISFYKDKYGAIVDENISATNFRGNPYSNNVIDQIDRLKDVVEPFNQDQLDWINDKVRGMSGKYLQLLFLLLSPGTRPEELDIRKYFCNNMLRFNLLDQKLFLNLMIESEKNNKRKYGTENIKDLVLLIYRQQGVDNLVSYVNQENYSWIAGGALVDYVPGLFGQVFIEHYRFAGNLGSDALPSLFDESSWDQISKLATSKLISIDDLLRLLNYRNIPSSDSEVKRLLPYRIGKLQNDAFIHHPDLILHPELDNWQFGDITDAQTLLNIAENSSRQEIRHYALAYLENEKVDCSSIKLEQYSDLLYSNPTTLLSLEKLTSLWEQNPEVRVSILRVLMFKLRKNNQNTDTILAQLNRFYTELESEDADIFYKAIKWVRGYLHPKLALLLWSWGNPKINEEIVSYICTGHDTYLRYRSPSFHFDHYPGITYQSRLDFTQCCQQVMLNQPISTLKYRGQYLYTIITDQFVRKYKKQLFQCLSKTNHSEEHFYRGIQNLMPKTIIDPEFLLNNNRAITDPVWRLLLSKKKQLKDSELGYIQDILDNNPIPENITTSMIESLSKSNIEPSVSHKPGQSEDKATDIIIHLLIDEHIGTDYNLSSEETYELIMELRNMPMGIIPKRAEVVLGKMSELDRFRMAHNFIQLWMDNPKLHNERWLLTLALLTPACEEILAAASRKRGEKSEFIAWELGQQGTKRSLQKLTHLRLNTSLLNIGDILSPLDKAAYEQGVELEYLVDELVLDTRCLEDTFGGGEQSDHLIFLNKELKVRYLKNGSTNPVTKIDGNDTKLLKLPIKELKVRAKLYLENVIKWLDLRRSDEQQWSISRWQLLFCDNQYKLSVFEGVIWQNISTDGEKLETFIVTKTGDSINSSGTQFQLSNDSFVQVWEPSITSPHIKEVWEDYFATKIIKSIYSIQLRLPIEPPAIQEDIPTHIINYHGTRVEKKVLLKVMKNHGYNTSGSYSGETFSMVRLYHTQNIEVKIRVIDEVDHWSTDNSNYLIIDRLDFIKIHANKYYEYVTPTRGMWSDITLMFEEITTLHEPKTESNVFTDICEFNYE